MQGFKELASSAAMISCLNGLRVLAFPSNMASIDIRRSLFRHQVRKTWHESGGCAKLAFSKAIILLPQRVAGCCRLDGFWSTCGVPCGWISDCGFNIGHFV